MNTKVIIEKLTRIADDLASEHGEFYLFGIFLREGVDARWDLVLSAPWLPRPSWEAIDLLARRLKKQLTANEMIHISAVIIAAPATSDYQTIEKLLASGKLPAELGDFDAFGIHLDHACIIKFNPPRANGTPPKPARIRKLPKRKPESGFPSIETASR